MATYFSQILVVLTLVTGIVWALERFVWSKRRALALTKAEQQVATPLSDDAKETLQRIPAWVDSTASVFPVLAFVLILRSFLYEPFQIPSGSMMPTLLVGDFILVEKYAYGLKDPMTRTQMLETGQPERGDIVVFKYPDAPTVDYIKRVVGLPGDRVIYRNKRLYIQPACPTGKACEPLKLVDNLSQKESNYMQGPFPLVEAVEQLGAVEHQILVNTILPEPVGQWYQQPGTKDDEWLVPEGNYFVLGDNRNNSRDSRFWGFVPEGNLVGKAVFIWMSFEFERESDSWLPRWIPTGVRFDRLGGIH